MENKRVYFSLELRLRHVKFFNSEILKPCINKIHFIK